MKFSTILAPLALAATAVARPGWTDWQGNGPNTCLTQADADSIVGKFVTFLKHTDVKAANATAQALIAPNFFEYSDSINILAGLPIGSVTFKGKDVYIGAVLAQPSVTTVTTLKALVAGCTNIIWYWNIVLGSGQVPVNGFGLFEITPDKKIGGLYLEFNSIAWGIDTGYTTFSPTGAKLPLA